MADPVVHFELHVADQGSAATFYSDLFGWKTETVPVPGSGDYTLVDTRAGGGINGGIGGSDDGRAWSTVYIEVPDVQATLDKVEELGGKVLMPASDIGMVILGLFADPKGNTVGVTKTVQPGQGVSAGDGAPVDWFEILGPDPKALWRFYGELFGWEIKGGDDEQNPYGMIEAGNGGIGGGIGDTPDGVPHVNVYTGVEDPQKYLDRAEELGGKTVVPVTDMGMVVFAQFADPQGLVFGLYKSAS